MTIDKNDLIPLFAREVFALHPYNNPPAIGDIVEFIKESFPNEIEFDDFKELQTILKDKLMHCQQFRQLNISKHDWDLGQREADNGIVFTDAYTAIKPEYNFIDLDALMQNLVYRIKCESSLRGDCFLCEHAKTYGSLQPSDCEACSTCVNNPNYANNHKPHPWSLLPRNSKEYQKLVKLGRC